MNSLRDFLTEISSVLSRRIDLFESTDQVAQSKCIRFSDITNEQSFSLILEHQWASTVIRFEPDLFAAEAVDFLAEQAFTKKTHLKELMGKYEGRYSQLDFKINNREIEDFELSEYENQIFFEAEVMTSNSLLSDMQINEQEKNILTLALELFTSLLPEPQFIYSSAEEAEGFPEGAVSKITVNRYERDPRNRMAAIKMHGYKCMACDFDFSQKYGPLGEDYIVVHHLTPVSQMGENYVVNPETDLNPLCANCHAMVHRQNPPLLPSELRRIIQGV